MKVLLTGGSSFTGMWFGRELALAGHEVVASFQKQPGDYSDGLRRDRVAILLESCRGVFDCSFGDPQFMDLVQSEHWDLICHHGADVRDYKSNSFDFVTALGNNTRNVAQLFDVLGQSKGRKPAVLLTGSVFENDTGAGSEGLPAFSLYGLSKAFTYQVFRFHACRTGLTLGRFVIPNPFGPYEEPRFTSYLLKTWREGKTATVNTPAYVRDNIHVSLLSRVYRRFAESLPERSGLVQICPSQYPEAQGAFTQRFAREIRARLDWPCELALNRQTEFSEPRVRINTDLADTGDLGWSEEAAWDELGAYYRSMYPRG